MATERGTFTLVSPHGLHARPAALFVQAAKGFASEITVRTGEHEANAKSILSVLTLGANQGDEVEVVAEGEDAAEAVARLGEVIADPAG